MTSRHAYCIIAHTDPYCLQTLIDLIDDERNDIILLFDKKAPTYEFANIRARRSRIITPPQLIDIQWGAISQIEAELLCFKTAIQSDSYKYIHLISGQDLPLKSQNHIHDFFDKLPSGTNMIGFAQGTFNKKDLAEKTDYFHVFTSYYRYPIRIIRIGLNLYRNSLIHIQKIIGFKRKWDLKPYKGCNWVSVTSEFAHWLVGNEKIILKMFKRVMCADEIYKQTLIMASQFKGTIYDMGLDFAGMTRKIDWTRGYPYTWHEQDFNELITSESLFARKFSSVTDKKIIDRIKEHILNNERQ